MGNVKTVKGRNTDLIKERNFKLLARFYWYNAIINLKSDKCIEILKFEFDISESRIYDLISENNNTLSDFENNKTTAKDFKIKIPYFNWNYSERMIKS